MSRWVLDWSASRDAAWIWHWTALRIFQGQIYYQWGWFIGVEDSIWGWSDAPSPLLHNGLDWRSSLCSAWLGKWRARWIDGGSPWRWVRGYHWRRPRGLMAHTGRRGQCSLPPLAHCAGWLHFCVKCSSAYPPSQPTLDAKAHRVGGSASWRGSYWGGIHGRWGLRRGIECPSSHGLRWQTAWCQSII